MTSVLSKPMQRVKLAVVVVVGWLLAVNGTPSYAKEFHGISNAVWSPDGRRIAFIYTDVGAQGSTEDLYVMGVESIVPAKMGKDVESFVWSPDSKQIAVTYYNSSGITVMNAVGINGDKPIRVSSNGRWPVWSADGSELFYVAGEHVSMMKADGSDITTLMAIKDAPKTVWQTQWSADRQSLAFLGQIKGDNVGLFVADKNGRRQLKTGEYPGSFSWSPDGKQIAVETTCENNPPGLCIYDAANGEATFLGLGHAPLWSPDGKQIAFWLNSQVCIMNADGTAQQCLTEKQENNIIMLHQWSPDGKRLLFSRAFAPSPNGTDFRFEFDTFILDVQRETVRRWFDASLIKKS